MLHFMRGCISRLMHSYRAKPKKPSSCVRDTTACYLLWQLSHSGACQRKCVMPVGSMVGCYRHLRAFPLTVTLFITPSHISLTSSISKSNGLSRERVSQTI